MGTTRDKGPTCSTTIKNICAILRYGLYTKRQSDLDKAARYTGLERRHLLIDVLQVCAAFLNTLAHCHFRLADPLARIVITLVWLVRTVWIANLALQVSFFGLVEVQKAFPIRPLGVGVDIHFHDATRQRSRNVSFLRARTSVEHKEVWHRLAKLLASVLLEVSKQARLEFDVSSFVN